MKIWELSLLCRDSSTDVCVFVRVFAGAVLCMIIWLASRNICDIWDSRLHCVGVVPATRIKFRIDDFFLMTCLVCCCSLFRL